jgi:PAT family acetyl-CoA transporter-like MFS transporter 1
MGLSAVVPFLLAEKKVGSLEQAVFSVVQYPFALKLLWAPLVDSVYSRAVGRRLSWILPVQPAIGALMLTASGRVEAMLGSSSPDVKALAGIFLALYLLAATQDIAVDGLALTALSPRNRELAATCNAIGQSAGYLLAYAGFLFLSSRGLCNIGGFMAFWGWAFLASTLAVLAARGKDEHDVPQGGVRQMRTTYLETRCVLQLPAVR